MTSPYRVRKSKTHPQRMFRMVRVRLKLAMSAAAKVTLDLRP
jgi:hypothetical protein